MGFIARQRLETTTFTDAIALEALERVLPPDLIQAAATAATVPTERRRKLPNDVTLLVCIAMSLFTQHALDVVLHKMVHGLRLFWPDPDIALATKSALSQARYRLGAQPVVALFHRVCRPLASVQTVSVPPGGATAVDLTLSVPGRYVLVDHALTRMERGLVGALIVDGPASPDIYRAADGSQPTAHAQH